jgi:hypothetical protein
MSFISDAIDAGFTQEQSEFLDGVMAKVGHIHSIDDVEGLEEALGADEDEDDEEDEEQLD